MWREKAVLTNLQGSSHFGPGATCVDELLLYSPDQVSLAPVDAMQEKRTTQLNPVWISSSQKSHDIIKNFPVWLTLYDSILVYLLSMIISKYLHVAANGIILFFIWLSNIPLYIMYHIFFIHSLVDRCLGCLHVLAIVNSAANNHCIFSDYGFLQIYAQEWHCRIIWQLYAQF